MTINGVDVLDVREAATYVGRTPETIRRWVWSGRIAYTRKGNRLLIARRDLEALGLATGSSEVNSPPSNDTRTPLSLGTWADQIPRAARREAPSAASLVSDDRWSGER